MTLSLKLALREIGTEEAIKCTSDGETEIFANYIKSASVSTYATHSTSMDKIPDNYGKTYM